MQYNGYIIEWDDTYECWCIKDKNGVKVREPYWGTCHEAREAIDNGEAL